MWAGVGTPVFKISNIFLFCTSHVLLVIILNNDRKGFSNDQVPQGVVQRRMPFILGRLHRYLYCCYFFEFLVRKVVAEKHVSCQHHRNPSMLLCSHWHACCNTGNNLFKMLHRCLSGQNPVSVSSLVLPYVTSMHFSFTSTTDAILECWGLLSSNIFYCGKICITLNLPS